MICDYSHTVTQYAGYKVVSWSSSECCRFLLHNRGIRFMLRKIHHTRSARRSTTNYINMIRLKTFSSPWRFTQLDQWNAQLLGCRLGNNVSLVSTLHRRLHQCTAAIQSSETAACSQSRAHSLDQRSNLKKSADPILGCFNLQLCELHPWLWVKTHGIFFCSHHSLTIPKIIACDSIIIPIPENKHAKPHFSWWLATISGLEVYPTIG